VPGTRWQTIFCAPASPVFPVDRVSAIKAYNLRNDAVRSTIPPACSRLGFPAPEEPFPHLNATHEYRDLLDRQTKKPIIGYGSNYGFTAPDDRESPKPRFLFVGWDWKRKTVTLVIRAFDLFRQRMKDATLDIVGHHPALDTTVELPV
jgi:glycosyltransferase involved in cell wall biosynthesis